MKWKALITETIALLFIILWIYAAVSKLVTFQKFQAQLSQSPLLTPFAIPISWFVPAIEIILAIMLIFESTKYFAMLASFSLMLFFTFYIVAITRFSDHVPCSCGGVLEKLDWETHLLFNIVFAILGAGGAALLSHRPRPILSS